MGDDLSLLLKIRGDAASGKAAVAETRAAVSTLRASLGSDFAAMSSAGKSAISDLGNNLNLFVSQRVPLVGGAFLRVTENLKGLGGEASKGEKELLKLNQTINGLATASGKSSSSITAFLANFVKIEGQAKRDAAAIEFLGAATAQKLIPQLEKAGTELATVAASSEAAGAGVAGMAGPIGLAVVGFIAMTVAVGFAAKEIFELVKGVAAFEGKMFDLSQQTGLSVETLSTLEVVAKTTGGSIESITASLGIFQRKLEESQDPASKTAETFESLNVATNNTEDALRQTLTALAAMPEGFKQTATALELFGRGGKGILAILKEMDGDLDGTIAKLKELGVVISEEDAKAADEFNDQLALLGFQARATSALIARDAIPPMLDALRALSQVLKDNREAIQAVGRAFGLFVEGNVRIVTANILILNTALETNARIWRGVQIAAALASGASIEAAIAMAKAGEELVKATQEGGVGEGVTGGLGGDAARARASAQTKLAAMRQIAAEEARLSAESIARAKIEFEQGRIGIATRTANVLSALEREGQAKIDAFNAEIDLKRQLRAADNATVADQRKIDEEILQLQQQVRNTRSELNRKVDEEEHNALQERAKQFIENSNRLLALQQKSANSAIEIIKTRVKAGELAELEGAKEIERIEKESFARRRGALSEQLGFQALGALTPDQIASLREQRALLNLEQTDSEREQAERIREIRQGEFDFQRSLQLQSIETEQRLDQIADESRIAQLRDQAARRIKLEGDVEREILAIRLAAKDAEIEAATKAGQAQLAGVAITDSKKRLEVKAATNAKLRILTAEHTAIEAQGHRDTQKGDDQDLEHQRKYAEELLRIKRQINDVTQEATDSAIGLMILRGARRIDIINAQLQAEIDAENARHQEAEDQIDAQQAEGKDEAALHRLREAELVRHLLRMQEIRERFDKELRKAGPEGAFSFGLDTGQLAQFANGIKSFADVAIVAFSAVGAAINGLAQGIGSMVQNWVLMGDQADISMQKLVASVLAGVAAQSAVLGVFELAKGFASLFWNPAEAIAHFQAAALFFSIAAITGLAGRAIAGNSFQQQGAGGSGGGSGSGGTPSGSGGSSGAPEPVSIGRRTSAPRFEFHFHGDLAHLQPKLLKMVTRGVNQPGDLRNAIKKEANS